jgi:hypothetical protein
METQNNELDLMRQQMTILKSKLDNEQIVNERLMRESMKNKMSWIHKFVWAEIFIVPLLIIFFLGTASAFGLSYGPAVLISVVLIASTTCDYKINKTGDKTFLSGNLVDEAAKLVRMKKLRIRYELYAIPAGLVWAIWFFLDIYNHIPADGALHDGLTGGLIGGCIGLIIGCFVAYYIVMKMQRTNDEVIKQINELIKEKSEE